MLCCFVLCISVCSCTSAISKVDAGTAPTHVLLPGRRVPLSFSLSLSLSLSLSQLFKYPFAPCRTVLVCFINVAFYHIVIIPNSICVLIKKLLRNSTIPLLMSMLVVHAQTEDSVSLCLCSPGLILQW